MEESIGPGADGVGKVGLFEMGKVFYLPFNEFIYPRRFHRGFPAKPELPVAFFLGQDVWSSEGEEQNENSDRT